MEECNITNCFFNGDGECAYCGDYYDLNSPNCISFMDKEGDEDAP